jgi:hypothetical protein
MSGHLADKAGFLAALKEDDPERKLAEEHARSCASCRDALDEGRRLVALLAQAAPLPAPSPELLRRAAAAIERENAGERRAAALVRWAAMGAVLLVWLLQLAYGKSIDHDLRSVLSSLAVLAVAVIGITFARADQRIVVAAMVATSALFAHAAGALSGFEPKFGAECTICELVAAAIPWLAVTELARRRHVPLYRWTLVVAAVAGALASQAAQLLTCPVARANPHLLVFHLGGVLLALALGAVSPLVAPADAAAS